MLTHSETLVGRDTQRADNSSKHSELAKFLKLYPTPEFPQDEDEVPGTRVCCQKRCGETFAGSKSKSYNDHPLSCWLERELVESPAFDNI